MFETILIIDNDTENTRRMIETLEARDYLVFTAPSRDAALTMARKVRPRLIFINPAMPEGGGLELCSTIHEEEEFKEVPIIMLSTFEGAADPRYTSLYGIVDSLKTPFVSEELVSKTEDVLSRQPVEVQSVGSEVGEPVEGEGIEIIEAHEKDSGKADLAPEEVEQEEEAKAARVENLHEEPAAYDETGQGKVTGERLSAYAMKRNMRRRGTRSALLMPVIGVAAVMILVLAAILFYERDSSPDKKAQPPAAAKPVQPSQEQPVNAGPAQEPRKPEESAGQSAGGPIMPKAEAPSPTPGSEPKAAVPKPEAKTEVPKSGLKAVAPKPEAKAGVAKAEKKVATAKPEAKAAVPKPEPRTSAMKSGAKPSAKGMYSAQMGAFKSEKNAEVLAKKYKEKGYEAFVYKTGVKDTELFYRVLIGKFKDKKEALQMVKSIGAKEGVQAILFRD